MRFVNFKKFSCVALISVVLTGCFGTEQEDLQRWMTEQRSTTKPTVVPIPAPKRFSPAPYGQEAAVEPFSSQKLTQALKRDSAQATANAG